MHIDFRSHYISVHSEIIAIILFLLIHVALKDISANVKKNRDNGLIYLDQLTTE